MAADDKAGADRRAVWEGRWADPGYVGGWRIDSIPVEIREAVEESWFPRGESLLDIGCGDGEIAAWLAQQGYDVLGIDFARAAIGRAQAEYGAAPGLTFDVVDIGRQPPGRKGFGALLDRGCLQGIPAQAAPNYVRNVAAVANPGARYLLLHRIVPNRAGENVVRTIDQLFREEFDIVRTADAAIGGRPGLASWMIRRP